MIKKAFTKITAVTLSSVMVLQLTACGTIFYPERKGAKSGEIDPIVAVADAIGLLFFFIPGVIAFAVDFNNGTIYKSGKRHSSLTPAELKSVSVNGNVDKKALSALMSQKLGLAVNLDSSSLQMKKFSSEAELLAHLNVAGLTLASR
jgi:hypothetical protein